MISKLIKHELKATLPSLSGVFIALLVLAVVGPFLLRINADWISAIVILSGVATFIAVSVVTFVVIINLFNKRTFSAQGYLNLTLPVTSTQLLLSKLFTAIIISIVTSLVSMLSMMIFMFSVSLTVFGGVQPLFDLLGNLFETGVMSRITSILFPSSIMGITGVVYSMSMLLLVITFIHTSYVRKNRVVVGVLSYLGLSLVFSTIQSYFFHAEYLVIGNRYGMMNWTLTDQNAIFRNIADGVSIQVDWLSLGMYGLFYLVLAGVFFTLTQYLIEHKLEIE